MLESGVVFLQIKSDCMRKRTALRRELRGWPCEWHRISAGKKVHQKEQVCCTNLVAMWCCCTLGNMSCKKPRRKNGFKPTWAINLDNLHPASWALTSKTKNKAFVELQISDQTYNQTIYGLPGILRGLLLMPLKDFKNFMRLTANGCVTWALLFRHLENVFTQSTEKC